MSTARTLTASVVLLALMLAACAPQRGPGGTGQADGSSQASRERKVLRVGIEEEAKDFLGPLSDVQTSVYRIADAGLTTFNSEKDIFPVLAAEAPSLDNGTWKIFPDNTMEVTWKLRPNIKWHDGAPMSSDDLVFFFEYLTHPETILKRLTWTPLVDEVSAPDAQTLVIHLKGLHIQANEGHGSSNPLVRGIPRHILGPTFASGDLNAFNNSAH